MKANQITVAFTGGGTGGHIFPGLAIAEKLVELCKKNGIQLRICYIASNTGMDKKIVEASVDKNGKKIIDSFYGISCGKLRRYFSLENFTDIFKILKGFFSSIFILAKLKPVFLFSKGGFVSVPPCFAAKILSIPVFTHECDFTPGLATKINSNFAKNIFLSYLETLKFFSEVQKEKVIVTGNPIRLAFYTANEKQGLKFLGITKKTKPLLLVLGGSSGSKQINDLVEENLSFLCKHYIVVHQMGITNKTLSQKSDKKYYHSYPFIYEEMPNVIAASDVVLSRAGANVLWECASLFKPLLLVPLVGKGTRGDQKDNALFFEKAGCALTLIGKDATSQNLQEKLTILKDTNVRAKMVKNCKILIGKEKPVEKISNFLYNQL